MPAADAFEDALADLRIAGTVLLHERYSRPWAIDVPAEAALRAALGIAPGNRVFPFHLVRRGRFSLRHAGTAHEIREAHAAICVGGAAHRMYDGSPHGAVPLERLLVRPPRQAANRDQPDAAELICGVVVLRAAPLNPLLAALPSVLRIATGGEAVDPLLAQATDLLARALTPPARGSAFVTARLVEIFCAEAIRAHAAQAVGARPGWFRGLADPKIGRVLALIHARPGARWSVASLAAAVALSPSRFAARFRESTGCSALAYVARWRMNVACRLLADGDPILAVASRVGYDSVPAFARAFKSLVGTPPGEWRAGARAGAATTDRR